ncbi:MAG: dienelactone hydrolase family protein, partial [Dehalococcoidales bacterium]
LIRFPCGDITLEGEWYLPGGVGPFPGIIICHPHPLYGGDMWNNIVAAIFRTLPEYSVAAFRFNFRGVGGSKGYFGGGSDVQQDVWAALDFLISAPGIDSARIGLAGYSFGGGVALPVAVNDARVGLLALVSPAVSGSNLAQLGACDKPKLVIVGDNDRVVPFNRTRQNSAGILAPGQYQVVPGADHFWLGYEEEVAESVCRFVATTFGTI